MGTLTISQISKRTGIASSALRFYERKGLIAPIGRAAGQRVYDDACLEQLALIDLLKIAGFTLTEIAELVDPKGRVVSDWRSRASAKQRELAERVVEIERAMVMLQHTIDCPHPSLHDCPVHRQVVVAHAETLSRH